MRHQIAELEPALGSIILVDRDMVDIAEPQAALAQAIGDRLRGKSRPMLDPAKPLLFRRGDQLAVAHQRRRSIGVEGVDAEDDQRSAALSVAETTETHELALFFWNGEYIRTVGPLPQLHSSRPIAPDRVKPVALLHKEIP